MRVIDPGHKYLVDCYDHTPEGHMGQAVTFMKREGAEYPGNVGAYPGTNCQELLRVLIDRVKYLNNQQPCLSNKYILSDLREALRAFEDRAAIRHDIWNEVGIRISTADSIETLPTCTTCGHIYCKHREAA